MAGHCDHREGLIDLVQIDIRMPANPSFPSNFLMAPTGASVNHSGSRAKLA